MHTAGTVLMNTRSRDDFWHCCQRMGAGKRETQARTTNPRKNGIFNSHRRRDGALLVTIRAGGYTSGESVVRSARSESRMLRISSGKKERSPMISSSGRRSWASAPRGWNLSGTTRGSETRRLIFKTEKLAIKMSAPAAGNLWGASQLEPLSDTPLQHQTCLKNGPSKMLKVPSSLIWEA